MKKNIKNSIFAGECMIEVSGNTDNLDKKQKIKSYIKKKSLIFLFIQDFMIKIKCSLIPIYLISRKVRC